MRRTWRLRLALVAGLTTWVPALGWSEPVPDHLWAKAGATSGALERDISVCEARVAEVPDPANHPVPVVVVTGGGIYGILAAAAIGGAMAAINEGRYAGPGQWGEEVVFHRCMTERRWVGIPLTPTEQAALQAAEQRKERLVWINDFLAGDLSARIAAYSLPIVPPLPEGHPEPLTFDGIRFDPAKLVPGRGVVGDDGVVLSGVVHFAHTARLRSRVVFPTPHDWSADAGAEFYQVVGAGAYDPTGDNWCGPFHSKSEAGPPDRVVCISTYDEGYAVWPASGKPPFAGPPAGGGFTTGGPGVDFTMQPSDQDLIGPVNFAIKASWLNFYNVELEADATIRGKHVILWRSPVPYDKDGVAVLPFWTHTLVLRRVIGTGVSVKFLPNGDGKGWFDAAPPQ